MFEHNKFCKAIGVKYPIIQGGMAGVSEANLVAAVSNAGGLGVIGSGFATPEWVREEVKKTKTLTDKPFGVNLLMQNPKVAELVKVLIEEKVAVACTGGGNPLPLIPYLKQAGIKLIAVVPTVRLAAKMEQNGADAVVVEGLESGGHIGENTTMCLVPQTANVVKNIPIVAGGGIYDGRTFLAAMALGAQAVQIGTRFMASKECQIHENYKQAILNATDEEIGVLSRFSGHPIRVIKNKLYKIQEKFEEKNPFPEEMKSERIAGSKIAAGNTDMAPLLCGIVAGGISEIKSCAEIIEEIVGEAQNLAGKAQTLFE